MIPFNKAFIVGKELYYIAQAVSSGHLSGDGEFTRKCHVWLEENLNCRKALLTHSCTAALEMAAILCDLQPGDEVIMPSFTFVSTANAFVLRGARPVFVDIRPDTLNIDCRRVRAAISTKTKAIVCVHYAGVACDMGELMQIAEDNGLLLIEDAAQALLSTWQNRCLGTIGHLGCLSFHETKNIISGEGGALLVNDDRFIERAEIIREKGTNRKKFFRGMVDKYTWVDIGSSYLPSELVSAFLFAQLEEAEKIIEKRRRLFGRYVELLQPLSEQGLIIMPFVGDGSAANGHLFYILLPTFADRTALIAQLRQKDILGVFHYIPLHSSPAGEKYGITSGSLEVTDDISSRLLRLPLFYEMNEEDVRRVADSVHDFFRTR